MTEIAPTASITEGTKIDITKVLRLRSMLQALRSEVREIEADPASLGRLASIQNEIESQLAGAIPGLEAELAEFSSCCRDNPNPSGPEIRLAQAQLFGWIEGLLQGLQFSVATAQREQTQPAPVEPRPHHWDDNPSSYL